MLGMLARYWWVLAVRGALAVLFGLAAFAWPGLTLALLILFFGAWVLVDGAFSLAAALSGAAPADHRWLLGLEGAAGIALGVLTYLAPENTAVVLLMFIAAWALVRGVLQIVAAVQLRKEIEGEWLLVVSGLASIAFAMILMLRPAVGALAVLWTIGGFAIAFGLMLIALAFRLRGRRLALA
ncbi:MAG TPA: HdeD family acid-resistance protein [Myxococcota bacterium]|jgi:uncharacterized membrane protein HdeD (DUF308 family)|nr:HdeD family acid-resistance protein [Myxococcota bacterium]